MSRKKKLIIGLVIAFLLGGASGGLYSFHFKPASSPISAQLKKQVPFQIYYPSDKKYVLVKDSLYYDNSLQLLYMKFQHGSDLLTITEQSMPASFSDSNIDGTKFLTKNGTGIIISNINDQSTLADSNSIAGINRVAGVSSILETPGTLISITSTSSDTNLSKEFISNLVLN